MKSFIISRGNPKEHPVLSLYGRAFKNMGGDVCFSNLSNILNEIIATDKSDEVRFLISDPIAFIIALPLMCFFKQKKIIFLSLEMFEYQIPNNKIYNKIRNKLFYFCHKLALKLSDEIIFCNQLRCEFYTKEDQSLKAKSKIMENYASKYKTEMTSIDDENLKLFKNICEERDTIFVYAGSIQAGRDLESIIDAFEESDSGACLVVAGNDKVGLFKNKKYKNVFYIGMLNKESLNRVLYESDYGILFYNNDLLNTKFAAPVKLYEYLCFNLKIISNNNTAMLEKSSLIESYYSDKNELLEILSEKSNTIKSKEKKELNNNYYIEDKFDGFF